MPRPLSLFFVVLLALPALASSKNHFHRTEARQRAAAERLLADHGFTGISVRAFRGRLVLGGSLPSGAALDALCEELRTATGATRNMS